MYVTVLLSLEVVGAYTCCSAYENIEITTRSHPDAFPSALRQARKTQTKKLNDTEGLQRVILHLLQHILRLATNPTVRPLRDVPSVDMARRSSNNCRFTTMLLMFPSALLIDLSVQLRSADEGSTNLYTVRRNFLLMFLSSPFPSVYHASTPGHSTTERIATTSQIWSVRGFKRARLRYRRVKPRQIQQAHWRAMPQRVRARAPWLLGDYE